MSKKKDKLDNEEKKIKIDYLDDLQRVQADFENYIKRANKERDEIGKHARASLILKFIVLLEDFERAMEVIKSENPNAKILEGIGLIYHNFVKVLEQEGLRTIEAKGHKFDYNKHDVIKKVDSDLDEDVIVEEVQKGYIYNDKILRSSKVIVSNGGVKNG